MRNTRSKQPGVVEYEDGRNKQVDHYLGDSNAPEELRRLENKIDQLAGINRYVKVPRMKSIRIEGRIMKQVLLNDVKLAASRLEGKRLETHHRRRQFHLKVEPEGLFYTPQSSGKGRLQEWRYIERVLDRFNETGSFSPSEYKDMSMNASYLLTVIRAIENPPPSRAR